MTTDELRAFFRRSMFHGVPVADAQDHVDYVSSPPEPPDQFRLPKEGEAKPERIIEIVRTLAAKAELPVQRMAAEIRRDPRNPFANVKQGEWDPEFNVTVHSIVMTAPTFVVYLDTKLELYWRITGDHPWPDGGEAIVARASKLEAEPTEHLSARTKEAFRYLIASAIASMLDGNVEGAKVILDEAGATYQARLREIARGWQLCSGALSMGVCLGAGLVLKVKSAHVIGFGFTGDSVDLAIAATAGSIGAFLSMFHRLGSAALDARAGKCLHVLESVLRVIAGVLAALLVAWASKAGIILTMAGSTFFSLLFWCALAGASERLVPALVAKLDRAAEGQATTKDPAKDAAAPSGANGGAQSGGTSGTPLNANGGSSAPAEGPTP